MPRGHRRIVITVAGLAFVASALFLLVRDLSTVDSAYSHAATDAAVKYQRDAHAYIKERCFAPPGLGEIDCASKADEAAREGQRKEQDLAAQNITAWWTKVMGIAALIGMALSAIGVWLVKTTFDETRKANDLAKLHQRARVQVNLEVGDLKQGFLILALRGENIGGSVALDASVQFSMSECPMNPFTPLPDASFEHTVRPGDKAAFSVMTAPVQFPQPFYVGGRASYRDIFGDTHETWFCFLIEAANPNLPLSAYIKGQSPLARVAQAKTILWPDDT
jgi:hypothetical protein